MAMTKLSRLAVELIAAYALPEIPRDGRGGLLLVLILVAEEELVVEPGPEAVVVSMGFEAAAAVELVVVIIVFAAELGSPVTVVNSDALEIITR